MKQIGVVTAGGDAPGMNAVIRATVRTATYLGLTVIGIEKGYTGLIESQVRNLGPRSVSGIINLGGTILRTARSKEIKTDLGIQKAISTLKANNIDGLVVIGGDGSFRGANKIYKASGLPVLGVPATIDNDVAGTDTTVGFDTAVNTALSAIDKIRDTATSHERVFIVEVMGRKRGFLALEIGLAAGAEFILIPEIEYNLNDICKKLEQGRRKGKKSVIIIKAEGAGSSKDIMEQIRKETQCDVRLTILGHVQRGGSPTAISRILANKFGSRAVELLLEGNKNNLVGFDGREIISIDLEHSLKKRKEINMDLYHLAEILSL